MNKSNFYNLEIEDKQAIFQAIASEKGMSPFAVEKDWWVSKTLEIIFQLEIAKHLVFKGGTSLSKAWKLINRFSEDIDLAIDKEYFFESEKNWSRYKITELRKEAGIYSTGTFFDSLKKEFEKRGLINLQFKIIEATDSDQDPRIIEIYYPNIVASNSEYLLPKVQIEVGCRSLREPFLVQSFGSLVDEIFSDRDFADPLFKVQVVVPERTFLEKLFLLHEEFNRPINKMRVDRLSRHLYDVFYLTKAGVAKNAIQDKYLYETIVAHRHQFSRVGGVDYNIHNPKLLNPIPPARVYNDWEADYAKMREEMIYDQKKPSFDDLIDNLSEIRVMLQSITWDFDLKF